MRSRRKARRARNGDFSDNQTAVRVFYSEPVKDAEIEQIIAGAKAFFANAGVPASALEDDKESADVIEAIAIWCKMAVNTDPAEMQFNQVLVALVDQLRNAPKGTP